VNGLGLIKVMEYAKLTGCVERFVYTNSEGGAYGSGSGLPFQEDDISLDLGSPYYISKMSGEAYGRFYFKQFGLPVTTVRLFNSFGPGEVPGQYRNVIPNFIFWALNGKPLPLTGNPEMARDFVFVADIVEGLLRAAFFEHAAGQSFNIASGKPVRIYELAEMINAKTGNRKGTIISGARKWDQRPVLIGDTTRAKHQLGFQAEYDFEKGIDRTIQWFRDNLDIISASAEFPPGKNPALDIG
jgi:UDP-glucose 4-epimerase